MQSVHDQCTTPSVPLVQGKVSKRVASAQGHACMTIVAAREAADHQATGAQLDAEGDVLRDRLADLLTVATATAKRERAYVTHSLLVDAMAVARRINELDAAEDWHLITEASAGVGRVIDSTHRSSAILEELLTGRESTQCGATRAEMVVPATGQVIRFAPCDQSPGHESASVHVFKA